MQSDKSATFSARDLVQKFSGRRVLDSLTLDVDAGSIGGLLGTNGSGKTTLLRVLLGLLPADSGSPAIDAVSIRRTARGAVVKAGSRETTACPPAPSRHSLGHMNTRLWLIGLLSSPVLALAQQPASSLTASAPGAPDVRQPAPGGLAQSLSLTDARVRETLRATVAQFSVPIGNLAAPAPRRPLAYLPLECGQPTCTNDEATVSKPAKRPGDFLDALFGTVLGIHDDPCLPDMPPQGLIWRTNKDLLPASDRPVANAGCGADQTTAPTTSRRRASSATVQPRRK